MRRALHRRLLWLWKTIPFPPWARQLYLRLTTPRFMIGALAIVRDEQRRVLMVKHTYRREKPWGLPGGWIEAAETVEEGLARELREETGLEVEVGRVLGVRPGPYGEIVMIFAATVAGGNLRVGEDEVSEVAFFEPRHVPDLEDLYREAIELADGQRASST